MAVRQPFPLCSSVDPIILKSAAARQFVYARPESPLNLNGVVRVIQRCTKISEFRSFPAFVNLD